MGPDSNPGLMVSNGSVLSGPGVLCPWLLCFWRHCAEWESTVLLLWISDISFSWHWGPQTTRHLPDGSAPHCLSRLDPLQALRTCSGFSLSPTLQTPTSLFPVSSATLKSRFRAPLLAPRLRAISLPRDSVYHFSGGPGKGLFILISRNGISQGFCFIALFSPSLI